MSDFIPATLTSLEYRGLLRDCLCRYGADGAATLRLENVDDIDAPIVFSTLSAAGLLSDTTVGQDLADTRSLLLALAGEKIGIIDEALLPQIPIDRSASFTESGDHVEALHLMIAQAGLANALPAGRARRSLEIILARMEVEAALLPYDAELAAAAQAIDLALDLDANHPARSILTLLQSKVP